MVGSLLARDLAFTPFFTSKKHLSVSAKQRSPATIILFVPAAFFIKAAVINLMYIVKTNRNKLKNLKKKK